MKRVIIVSDGTGETAAQTVKAAMVQFTDQIVTFTRYKNVRSESQIEAICEDAAASKDLLVYTIVSPQLRALLQKTCWQRQIPSVDLLGPMLIGLANYFGYEPKMIAGLLRDVNEDYFHRIEAMEYTISHDDGRNLENLELADLVILGISRTSKTPISMYLSHHGWRVANIPLITGFEVPEEVYKVDPRKVVCLTIDPEELMKIRRTRLQKLGQKEGGDYADLENIVKEVEYARELFAKNRKWSVFDATDKAIEETASEIIKLMSARKLIPPRSLEAMSQGSEGPTRT
jgi:regulator of PEP synthase PpsR (kinase-PPPase family)